MKRLTLLLLICLSLCVGCSCNPKKAAEPVGQMDPVLLYSSTNDFAFDLYAQADAEGKNLFYSPYSISGALSMCYGGAKGNTAAEMAKALSFNLPVDEQHKDFRYMQQQLNAIGKRDNAELNVANALFGAKRTEKLLVPDFLKLLREYYDSDVYSLNFDDAKGTAKYINDWVLDKTNDRIKDLVSEQHIQASNDGLVLVNAIFFKGKWLKQFDPKKTNKDDFYTSPGENDPKTVDMMSMQGDFRYAELPGYQVLELPYEEKDLAMLFVLPEEIGDLKDSLNSKILQTWQNALQEQEVKVYIPRFKFELTLDGLPDKLKAMGMIDAFSDMRADFSGIRKAESGAGLYILDIIHKAFVEVKEEGTEAAAATAVIMATKAAPGPGPVVPTFRADRPFLYMIMHKPTNTVLFLGKYASPPESK